MKNEKKMKARNHYYPNNEDTKYMIYVMKSYINGKKIQFRINGENHNGEINGGYQDIKTPIWNWEKYFYIVDEE